MNDAENNKTLHNALKAYGLKRDIGRIRREMTGERSVPVRNVAPVKSMFGQFMKVAAAIMLLIIGTAVFIYMDSTPENLFGSKYELYKEPVQRGEPSRTSEIKTKFLQAQDFIQSGDTEKAILIYSDILHTNSRRSEKIMNDDAEYYLALAYLKAEQPENALPIFENIHNNTAHLYNDQVGSWFLMKVRIAAWKK